MPSKRCSARTYYKLQCKGRLPGDLFPDHAGQGAAIYGDGFLDCRSATGTRLRISGSTFSRSTKVFRSTSSSICPSIRATAREAEKVRGIYSEASEALIAQGRVFLAAIRQVGGDGLQPGCECDPDPAHREADCGPEECAQPREALFLAEDASGEIEMALEDYRADAMRCTRCAYCKWIPFDLIKSARFARGCPSMEAGKFHSYSAGGRLITALFADGRPLHSDRKGEGFGLQVQRYAASAMSAARSAATTWSRWRRCAKCAPRW